MYAFVHLTGALLATWHDCCAVAGGQRWWRERVVKHGVLHSGTIRPDPRSDARTALFRDAFGPSVANLMAESEIVDAT